MSKISTPAGLFELAPDSGGLRLVTPYDRDFVDKFKALVPMAARVWSNDRRAWIIATLCGPAVAQLVYQHYGVALDVPQASSAPSAPEARVVRLDYLGACKSRDDGTISAYGSVAGAWSLVFPEAVLRAWFKADDVPTSASEPAVPPTLYSVLAVGKQATTAEIKSAYRRLARQWHPDVCREPDAATRFQQITQAYDVLSDDQKRRKYGAGLALQAAAEKTGERASSGLRGTGAPTPYYRAPLRCGQLLVMARPVIGRLLVESVLRWDDIVDMFGKTLVVSWPAGADRWQENWI